MLQSHGYLLAKRLENLAHWFFRLNGCLTIPNFVVHPESDSGGQRTDADLIAVRFPHRCERLLNNLDDDCFFGNEKTRLQVFFVEVKTGVCAINRAWRDAGNKNVNTMVSAIGFARRDTVDTIAEKIRTTGKYSDEAVVAQFVCVGRSRGTLRSGPYPPLPEVQQILYARILEFIYWRFVNNDEAKRDQQQWDEFGQNLFKSANRCGSVATFSAEVLKNMETWK